MMPICGKCGYGMTPLDSRLRPELFLHDACLPDELKPGEIRMSQVSDPNNFEPQGPIAAWVRFQAEPTPEAVERAGGEVAVVVHGQPIPTTAAELRTQYQQMALAAINAYRREIGAAPNG